jgi:hypothetical protein
MELTHAGRAGLQEVLETPLERRRGLRFNLRLSCRVFPVSTEGIEFPGTVINISRSGILVGLDSAQIATLLKPQSLVRVAVDLPRHPAFSPRFFECTATVVRIVAAEAQTQVALEIGRIRVNERNAKATSTADWLSAPIEGLIQ